MPQLKQINWDIKDHVATARVMGITLSVYENNNKWDSRLSNGHDRPEIQTGLDHAAEAMKYAEDVLLQAEIKKYFY